MAANLISEIRLEQKLFSF